MRPQSPAHNPARLLDFAAPCPHPSLMQHGLPFPEWLHPEIFSISLFGMEFALRWYAMAYIVGIIIGWRIAVMAVSRPTLWRDNTAPLTREQVEDLLSWIVLGVIAGGRLGYVLFYGDGQYRADPLSIFRIWDGGMSFHGGFIGVCLAVFFRARAYQAPLGDVANILALTATPAILLARIANFINAELYGRETDLPWGVRFPSICANPTRQPCDTPGGWFYYGDELLRHPSQLYEAGLEGLLLGAIILMLAFARGWLKRRWSLVAVFLVGYGLSRFAVEFVRQPDTQFTSPDNPIGWAYDFGSWGLTQGQALSLPMILAGLALFLVIRRRA